MSDPIDRQDAIDALKSLEFRQYMEFGEYIGEDIREVCLIRAEKAQDALQSLPSAQPQRIKGRWVQISPAKIYECSICGKNVMTSDIDAYDFCHGCGNPMEVIKNGHE